jgi:hypothetical protein
VYSAIVECLEEPESEDLELYMFRTTPDKFVEIRIDKVRTPNPRIGTGASRDTLRALMYSLPTTECVQLTNKYGSPALDDIERLARGVNSKLEESLGEDAAGEIEIGISSPVRLHARCPACKSVTPLLRLWQAGCFVLTRGLGLLRLRRTPSLLCLGCASARLATGACGWPPARSSGTRALCPLIHATQLCGSRTGGPLMEHQWPRLHPRTMRLHCAQVTHQ